MGVDIRSRKERGQVAYEDGQERTSRPRVFREEGYRRQLCGGARSGRGDSGGRIGAEIHKELRRSRRKDKVHKDPTTAAMNSPKMYSSASEMQRRDAAEALSRYVGSMTWAEDSCETVLDIGCGSGEVTRCLLLPLLPATGRVVGVDASEAMVRFAAAKHRHPRLSFRKMDIVLPNLRKEFPLGFQKVFSFFCLHWVQEQRQALRNVYELLVPGGEALLVFLASSPIFNVYEQQANDSRWSKYMRDYTKFVSPYHHSKKPQREMHELLQDIGFDVLSCDCRERVFVHNGLAPLKDAVRAINPFMDRIPDVFHDDYLTDILSESRKLKNLVQIEDEKVTFKYRLFEILVKRKKC